MRLVLLYGNCVLIRIAFTHVGTMVTKAQRAGYNPGANRDRICTVIRADECGQYRAHREWSMSGLPLEQLPLQERKLCKSARAKASRFAPAIHRYDKEAEKTTPD